MFYIHKTKKWLKLIGLFSLFLIIFFYYYDLYWNYPCVHSTTVIKNLRNVRYGFITIPPAKSLYFILYKTTANVDFKNVSLNMIRYKQNEKLCIPVTACYDDKIYFSKMNDRMISTIVQDKSFFYIPPGKYIITIEIEGYSEEEISNLSSLDCVCFSTKKLLANKPE